MYQIENLKYRNILDIDKMEINRGNIYIVSGPSGSGKSSLINLLMANDYDYEGKVYYDQTLLKDVDSMIIKKQVTSLVQESVLLGKTIAADFQMLCELLKIKYDEVKIKQVLDLVTLDLELSTKTHKMSGGQKQRMFIARTLYLNRETYILDEPTSALDPETSKIIMNNLYTFAKTNNKLLIVISHDAAVIEDARYEHIYLGGNND